MVYRQNTKEVIIFCQQRTEPSPTQEVNKRKSSHRGNSDATIDKTDEESSYSSLYSSFFKTESGSTEESEVKNKDEGLVNKYYLCFF